MIIHYTVQHVRYFKSFFVINERLPEPLSTMQFSTGQRVFIATTYLQTGILQRVRDEFARHSPVLSGECRANSSLTHCKLPACRYVIAIKTRSAVENCIVDKGSASQQ